MPTRTGLRRVDSVMTRNPVCVMMSDSVCERAQILGANDISAAPVIDHQERVIGIVSKTDLIRHCLEDPFGSRGESFWELLTSGPKGSMGFTTEDLGMVEEIMSRDPITAPPDEPVAEVARCMSRERVHHIIIVNDRQRPIGVVSALDVLGAFPE
jgi:CBS domain-containing protein